MGKNNWAMIAFWAVVVASLLWSLDGLFSLGLLTALLSNNWVAWLLYLGVGIPAIYVGWQEVN